MFIIYSSCNQIWRTIVSLIQNRAELFEESRRLSDINWIAQQKECWLKMVNWNLLSVIWSFYEISQNIFFDNQKLKNQIAWKKPHKIHIRSYIY